MKKTSFNRGFTLIELLVVIAIIGLLSSVVLASLKTARDKAQEAAIIVEANQFRTLAELEYSETGSYANLQPGTQWVLVDTDCDSLFTQGKYKDKAIEICKDLSKNVGTGLVNGPYLYRLYFGIDSLVGTTDNKYSMMVWLPVTQKFLCAGSSGISNTPGVGVWPDTGCFNNP